MSPQESSRWSIMSVAIDANSRAPPHTTTTSVSQQTYITTYQTSPGNHSRESLAQSHVSFRSGAESSSNLLHHSPQDSVYHRDVSSERRIWQEAQRPKLEKFGAELRSKLRKVRQSILRESAEAIETRHLLASCRTSPLATKVQKARKACVQKQRSAFLASSSAAKEKEKGREEKKKEASTPPTPSTPASSFPSLPGLSTSPSSLDSTPPDSRKGSIASIISAFSLSPRRSSTTSLSADDVSPASTPLRQRKISLPLEYDPNFHPRQLSVSLEHRNTSEGGAPVFRMPKWTPPSPDDCRACEIIRIVKDCIREEGRDDSSVGKDGNGEVKQTKVLRRLSDEKGNLFIEQVRERDERGRKRVLLSWGEDVDVVIPSPSSSLGHDSEVVGGDRGSTRKSRLRWRLGGRYKALCDIMKRVFREEGVRGEADLLWEVYP